MLLAKTDIKKFLAKCRLTIHPLYPNLQYQQLFQSAMFSPVMCWLLFFVWSSVIPETAHAQEVAASYHPDLRQNVFIREHFRYLNVPRVGTFTMSDIFDCTLKCLSNPSCFSLNLAASKGVDGKLWCELLSSNKYINPDEYKGNKSSHHYSSIKVNFRPTSCLDYLLRGATKNSIYKLYDNSGNSFPAYCDLKSEPGTAWTLVMSWSDKNRALPAFRNIPFKKNAPVNENAQNWNLYRLSLTRMKSLQAHSTHWRATCSYPTQGVDFRDYVRGNFKDFNIVDFIGTGQCKKVEYVNIRGHSGTGLTAKFWQTASHYFLHIDSSHSNCQFNPSSGSVSREDNFGYHSNINPNFRCTQGSSSTTQWWFGAHL